MYNSLCKYTHFLCVCRKAYVSMSVYQIYFIEVFIFIWLIDSLYYFASRNDSVAIPLSI